MTNLRKNVVVSTKRKVRIVKGALNRSGCDVNLKGDLLKWARKKTTRRRIRKKPKKKAAKKACAKKSCKKKSSKKKDKKGKKK